MADHALGRRIDHLLRLRTVPPRKSGLSLTAVVLAGIGVGASAALLDEPQLVGWQAQQIRWESATRANGLFLHGEVTLEPGRLGLGREGLLLALAEDGGELHTCVAWRNDVRARRFECDRPGAPQQHLDALLGEAAPLWPDDPGSPLSAYWQPDPAAATRYAGSHIIGIPGRSRNPDREILQAGWITSDGARIGVFRRADAFATAFRYRPDTRGLLLIRTIGGGAPAAWSNGSWRSASRQESNWFHATLEQLDADNSARSN